MEAENTDRVTESLQFADYLLVKGYMAEEAAEFLNRDFPEFYSHGSYDGQSVTISVNIDEEDPAEPACYKVTRVVATKTERI